ncbi:hypothetical protein K492DRAFT_193474 [Lichtheimia hyalospora FSU 10163]|nr:hypothetical protein K492DRAFT_193474 [Lichtheimia hyalospora FSU 10163]
MSWIIDGYFPHLCSLQIYKCTELNVGPLVVALKKIGYRLRNLLLEFMVELIPYQDVMRLCPNLTEFCYYTALDNRNSNDLMIPANTKLMHLELHVGELLVCDLEQVLQAYPNIRYLSVQRCDKIALRTINEHCPYLEFLSFNAAPYLLPWMRLLGKETATSIGLSRDIRSSRRLGIKTAELLASEFLDHFPHGMAKWTSTLNVGRLQAYRRTYDRDMHPKIIAAVFPSNEITIAEICTQFLSKSLLFY